MLNLGVAKTFSNALELGLDVNYFYNEYADAGTILGVNINGQLKNDWEIALGTSYPVDESLTIGGGAAFFKTGFTDEIRRSNRYSMDTVAVGSKGELRAHQKLRRECEPDGPVLRRWKDRGNSRNLPNTQWPNNTENDLLCLRNRSKLALRLRTSE